MHTIVRAIFTCDLRVIPWLQGKNHPCAGNSDCSHARSLSSATSRWKSSQFYPLSVRKSICRLVLWILIYHFIFNGLYNNSHQKVILISWWSEWSQNVPASLFPKTHWLSRKTKRTLTLYQNVNTNISDSYKNFQQLCIRMSEHSQSKRIILLVCVAVNWMIKQYILMLLPRPRLVMREFSNSRLYITQRPWKII